MYFSEVDVELRKSRSREPVASLTNIKSSDDISSGYSSGEALQSQNSQKSPTTNEHLVRTASVGARNRGKPRTTTKKAPEVEDLQEDDEPIENIEKHPVVNSLSFLTSEQAQNILSFLSEHKDHIKKLQNYYQTHSDSDDDSSTINADSPSEKEDDKTQSSSMSTVIDVKLEDKLQEKTNQSPVLIDAKRINSELCSENLDELKVLLQTANKAVASMSKSQENLNQFDSLAADNGFSITHQTSNLLEIKTSPSISRSSSDCSERAGKYHKKPAPKAPELIIDEDEDEGKPLKATLVIKPGTIKTLTNNEAVDEVIKRRKKSTAKTAARESFSKLLTIPKNIFHNAFHKEKDEDSKSIGSDGLRSRSGSREHLKADVDVVNVLPNYIGESWNKSVGDTYISLKSDGIDCDFVASAQATNCEDQIKKSEKEGTIV